MHTQSEDHFARKRTDLARTRTRLANRRTFLAWCRTVLAFMGFGFLLERIDLYFLARAGDVSAKLLTDLGLLGQAAFTVGPLLIVLAGGRFCRTERELGVEKPLRTILPEVVMIAVILGAALFHVFA